MIYRILYKYNLPVYLLKALNVSLSNAIKLGGLLKAIDVSLGVGGFQKIFNKVINRVGQVKILCLLTSKVGGWVKKERPKTC